ncbi:MAG: glycoside hydrolase family 20 zincin-like fold domain-containing protein [Armatimonadota bacterium]|nr:glycoside hydrolase family 20 zincin-like fold domain-containing protein [Armatimonadota bacterium]
MAKKKDLGGNQQVRIAIISMIICCFLAVPLLGAVSAISPEEAKAWTMYLVPLPKQVKITAKNTVLAKQVAIRADSSDPMVIQACKELRQAIGIPENAKPPTKPGFTIILKLGGSEASSLKNLKNSDQAYRITAEAGGKGLRLISLTPRGLYYAAKTLQQLVKAKAVGGNVEMPIVEVTDWPDLEDRGLWGSDSFRHLRWLADRKINIIEQISYLSVDEKKVASARPKDGHEPLFTEGPLYGIKFVPVVLHLEQVGNKGVFAAYPNLKAKGGGEGAICYSQPEFVNVLADWIVALGKVPHVREVDVWLSENLNQQGGCTCEECRKVDRSVLEIRTVLAAWNKAKRKLPALGLRVTTSEETESSNQLVFKELPKDVKVWYYHSLLTYDNGEVPMLRKYLADFAKSGQWLGVVPNLDAGVHWTSPFTSPHFIHYRMNEFVDKGLSGLLGYATPRVHYNRFNVDAAAEWSWNSKGRTPREFAESWAVRQGIRDAKKFAEWVEFLSPVAWDVYGSHWPAGEQRNTPGHSAKRLKEGTLPELGFVLWDAYRLPFGDIKSEEQLKNDVVAADKAVKIAKEMEIPIFISESLIIQGYINSLNALWELRKLVGPEGIAPENKKLAQDYFQAYVNGLNQVIRELPNWESLIPDRSPNEIFTGKQIAVIARMIEEMRCVASGFGIELE